MNKDRLRRGGAKDPSDFFVGYRRAMVSLGPLSPKKYCSYSCPFCYVHADFSSYPKKSVSEIIDWSREKRTEYDIVYVSGDTDSFAPPRTDIGLELLENLLDLDVDILFTTRAVFSKEQLNRLGTLSSAQRTRNKLLFGCVSICRLRTGSHLEPPPIPNPEHRIEQLREFKTRGLISILAMRPFLPLVPVTEYVDLAKRCRDVVDGILGEVWYADKAGALESQVFQGHVPAGIQYVEHEMDFDANEATWKVWLGEEIEKEVTNFCQSNGIPFFMRSRPAIEYFRRRFVGG